LFNSLSPLSLLLKQALGATDLFVLQAPEAAKRSGKYFWPKYPKFSEIVIYFPKKHLTPFQVR
jgi:hypothetical protein